MPDPDASPQDAGGYSSFSPADMLDDDDLEEKKAPAREGLPSTYRMRADPHYVELLAAASSQGRDQLLDPRSIECKDVVDPGVLGPLVASIRTHGVLQPLLVQNRSGRYRLIAGRSRLKAALAADLRKVPCIVHEVDDEAAGQLAAAAGVAGAVSEAGAKARQVDAAGYRDAEAVLAQSLRTLSLCANLVSTDAPDLPTVTAGHLLRAELWRASCLVQAIRVVRGELTSASAMVGVRKVLERVAQELVPEQRLRGFEVDVVLDLPAGSTVMADEPLLVGLLAGGVLATIPLFGGVAGGRVTLSASSNSSSNAPTLLVSQTTVRAPDVWAARAFDPRWTDRPGGVAALMFMQAIDAAARGFEGTAAAESGPRGTSIAIAMPNGRTR
jgi:hypothetical protein